MSAQPIPAKDDYRELMAAADRYLAKFDTRLSREDREEIRQDAFAGLALERSRKKVDDTEAVLITCARNAAKMRLRCADRRRRHSFNPLDSPEARIPDRNADPQELVVRADEERRLRVLIEQLGERERAVLKLRLDQELEVKQIAGRLGLSNSRAHWLLKQGGQALVDAIGASELGEFSRRQRSLLAAIVMGIATERQRRAGDQLLEDPHARALLAELRGLGQKTAAALPLPPAIAAEHSTGRLSELATHIKGQLAEAAGAAKQHASAVYVRAGDPTPLAGARPGTVAATLASCLALGGGTYCAVDGLPTQLGAPLGLEGQAKPEADVQETAPEQPNPEAAPITPARAAEPPAPAPKPAAPVAPATPAPTPAPAPPPAEQQFGIEPSPTPAPAPKLPSGGGGGGEFGIE